MREATRARCHVIGRTIFGRASPWPLGRTEVQTRRKCGYAPGHKIWPGLRPRQVKCTQCKRQQEAGLCHRPENSARAPPKADETHPVRNNQEAKTCHRPKNLARAPPTSSNLKIKVPLPHREEMAKAERGVASHKPPHTATYQVVGAGEARVKSPRQGHAAGGRQLVLTRP